jgi:hypothetical protein
MLEFGWRNVYSTENPEQERETGFLTQAKLRCGQDLVPTPGNKEWQSVSTEKSRFFS